jgi:recombinational DNA repair protein RecT
MAKKTVFRRASKWIPLSSEIRDAYERDDDSLVEATPTKISVTELRSVFDAPDSAEVAEPVTENVVGGNL